MFKKLKSFPSNDAIFMAGLLLTVGILSFGLGRLSLSGDTDSLEKASSVALVATVLPQTVATSSAATTSLSISQPAVVSSSAPYVGSKSGTKYHLATCSGAKRIKPENKIYFNTTAEAEAAGYSKAANCPGL